MPSEHRKFTKHLVEFVGAYSVITALAIFILTGAACFLAIVLMALRR